MATRLRDRMIAEMEVRGLKEATREQYLYDVEKFFEFYKGCSMRYPRPNDH